MELPQDDRVRIQSVEVLSDDWYVLKKTTFEFRRKDGSWQRQSRETYDRGNGSVILLYNRQKQTVILTRQFRFPAFVNGLPGGMLVEACAGLLDEDEAEACIKREAEEETGYRVGNVRRIFEAYMSPGSVTEKLYFFVAEYTPESKVSEGGGELSDGEDIEVLELELERALRMIDTGEIADGKTIMLLYHAKLKGLLS
jgi:nudix-type nucleoside diphosphatase (YffH/AdpP family)